MLFLYLSNQKKGPIRESYSNAIENKKHAKLKCWQTFAWLFVSDIAQPILLCGYQVDTFRNISGYIFPRILRSAKKDAIKKWSADNLLYGPLFLAILRTFSKKKQQKRSASKEHIRWKTGRLQVFENSLQRWRKLETGPNREGISGTFAFKGVKGRQLNEI